MANFGTPDDIYRAILLLPLAQDSCFDEVFFNKICRNAEVVSLILSKKLTLNEKQLERIAQSKFIQGVKEESERFEKLYAYTVTEKRLSINKLSKYTRDKKLTIGDDPIHRTIKIGIDWENTDEESKTWLQKYIIEWDSATIDVLSDLYNKFREEPSKLIIQSAKVSYLYRNKNSTLEPEIDSKTGQQFEIQMDSKNNFRIFKLTLVDESTGKVRNSFIAENNGLAIYVDKDKKTEEYKIKKFDSTILGNYLDKKYITKKEDQPEEYKGLKLSDKYINIKFAQFREPFRAKIAQTICSYLDKYYNSLFNIDKTYKVNAHRLKQNIEFISDNFPIQSLKTLTEEHPKKPSANQEEIYRYNAFITTYNQFINEYIWQKSFDTDIKDKVKKLQVIKGVPSFPVVEKQSKRDYQKIYKEIQNDYTISKDKVSKVGESKVDVLKLAEWLSRKWTKSGKDASTVLKQIGERLDLKEVPNSKYPQLDVPKEKAFSIWKEVLGFLDELIHTNQLNNFSDTKEVRRVADIYAQYISFSSELTWDKKTQEYFNFRIRFNTNTALLKASPFEELKDEKKEISFSGFSADKNGLKKGFAFAYKEVDGKLKFYLIFNLYNNIHLKFNEGGEYSVVAYEGDNRVIKGLSFDEGVEGTCILPLSFGKRIGRKYFYNNFSTPGDFNQLDFLKSHYIKFSNLRVIQEKTVSDNKNETIKYYAAISLERDFGSTKQAEYSYNELIGVDMGEKIPAVMAGVRLDNTVHWVANLHEEMNDKLFNIQRQKDEAQREKGAIPKKLTSRISNVTQKLLEDISIEALEKAVKKQALIVTEDLARGFGRGSHKGTYVWMRQYTKLNDILALKASELGLIKSPPEYAYSQHGILAKVPASYTSKTSIQTGFILRSPSAFKTQDESISGLDTITLKDDIFVDNDTSNQTTFELNLDTKEVTIAWKDNKTTKKFSGRAENLDAYYSTSVGKEKFEKLMSLIFEQRKSNSEVRRKKIAQFIYSLLNPRRQQDTYTDIFTGKSVNADAQGAINIARSFNFGQCDIYNKYVKKKNLSTGAKLHYYQKWYLEYCVKNKSLPEIPNLWITSSH